MDIKKIIKEEVNRLSEKQKRKILRGQELEEARMKKVTEKMWKYMSDDKRFDALLSVVKDPNDAEKLIDTDWKNLPSGFERDMTIYEEKINKSDVNYQIKNDYKGNTPPKIVKLNNKEISIFYGYKVNPKDVIKSFKQIHPNITIKHVKWSDISSGGGTHTFKITEGKLTEADRRLSNSQWEALENMNDWLPKGQEEEYLEIMNQGRAPAMIKFLKKYADMKALNKYGVKSSDLKTLAGALMNEGKLNESFDQLPDVSFKRLARPPKRFTVKKKFTIDGTNYSEGDYALKKKRSGGGIYLNMDKGEMLGIDTDTIARMQKADYGIYEGKLNESREFVIIDPRGNARPVGSKMQASQYTKKMGGPNKGWFIVLKKNALKARRAIEKSGMRYKDSKLQDTMFDLMYEGKLNESMIGIKTKANFKPLQLKGALEKAKIKGFQMNRLSVTLTALKLDKKYYKEAMKIIDDLGLAVMMAKEGKLTEAARAMDWIEDAYGEIGQIHKVRGRAAYVKFPSTKDIAFDVVDIQTLKKTGKKHKGKDLYLAESNINLDTDKLGIVENLTNKEMMVLIEKLKMKQDRPMLTWKSPGDGVHVMVVQSGMVKAIFPHKGDIDEAKTAMKILKVKGLKVIGELNERLDHESAMDILDAAAGYTSTAHVAANQQWWDAQALYDYLISDHIPKKFHKKFFKSIGKKYKLKETIDLRKIFMKGRKKKRTKDEGKLTEAELAKGLKPLLKLGSTITKKAGEATLIKLSDKFDRIDDEYAGEIASWLDMAIELMQDGYPGDATKKLKQFNQKCKDVLKGKSIKSAFAEGKLNEAEYGYPTGTKTLKSIDAKFDDAVFKVPPHKITRDWVLKIAKKYKVDPKEAIQWVNLNPKINIKEGDEVMNEATAKDTLKNAVVALTKTFGGKKIDKNYVKKYLKSIEQIAKRKPQDFVKDYGDFEVKDWIEDVEYNMQNEGKISTKRLSEIIIEEYEKLLAKK